MHFSLQKNTYVGLFLAHLCGPRYTLYEVNTMNSQKVAVTFSNDAKIILTSESILYPISTSGTGHPIPPLILSDVYRSDGEYIQKLVSFFASTPYFTLDDKAHVNVHIYSTAAIVSFKQYNSNLTKSSLFK